MIAAGCIYYISRMLAGCVICTTSVIGLVCIIAIRNSQCGVFIYYTNIILCNGNIVNTKNFYFDNCCVCQAAISDSIIKGVCYRIVYIKCIRCCLISNICI